MVVDFWAEWCGPCRMIAPALEELSTELGEKITVAKINIDENPQVPMKYGVRGIPTLMIFANGQVGGDQGRGAAQDQDQGMDRGLDSRLARPLHRLDAQHRRHGRALSSVHGHCRRNPNRARRPAYALPRSGAASPLSWLPRSGAASPCRIGIYDRR